MKSNLRSACLAATLLLSTLSVFGQHAADSARATEISSVTIADAHMYAGTKNHGVYISTDAGRSWKPHGTGLPPDAEVPKLAIAGGNLLAQVHLDGSNRNELC